MPRPAQTTRLVINGLHTDVPTMILGPDVQHQFGTAARASGGHQRLIEEVVVRTSKSVGRLVGALFILASATAIVGGSLLLPIQQPDFLSSGGSRVQLVIGALLEMTLAAIVITIASVLVPVLWRTNVAAAVLYVATRTLEAGLIIAAATSALVMTSLVGTDATTAIGDLMLSSREWTYRTGTLVVFGASAIILNAVLLRGRTVPPWLARWGLIGGGLLLLRGLIELCGVGLVGAAQIALAAPIGIEEMVFAVWLIVKGLATATPEQPTMHAPTVSRPTQTQHTGSGPG